MYYGSAEERLSSFDALLKEGFGRMRSPRWLGLERGNAVYRKRTQKKRDQSVSTTCRLSCITKAIVEGVAYLKVTNHAILIRRSGLMVASNYPRPKAALEFSNMLVTHATACLKLPSIEYDIQSSIGIMVFIATVLAFF